MNEDFTDFMYQLLQVSNSVNSPLPHPPKLSWLLSFDGSGEYIWLIPS